MIAGEIEIEETGLPGEIPALPDVRRTCLFLSEYAVELFGSGSTCIRLDNNIRRMAASLGMNVEFSILPRHIHITVTRGEEAYTAVVGIRNLPISFSRITDLSRLSWELADHKIDFEEARLLLPRICNCHTIRPLTLNLLVSLAGAAFCRLFNGDLTAMAFVFIATFVGFFLKVFLIRREWDVRIVVLISSFISALIASLDGMFGLGATPGITIGTSVLYLVPGIPFINSFCDLLDGHYLCAFGRALNAGILLCCLSMGLFLAMTIMHVGMF